jgi:hypothetical protein
MAAINITFESDGKAAITLSPVLCDCGHRGKICDLWRNSIRELEIYMKTSTKRILSLECVIVSAKEFLKVNSTEHPDYLSFVLLTQKSEMEITEISINMRRFAFHLKRLQNAQTPLPLDGKAETSCYNNIKSQMVFTCQWVFTRLPDKLKPAVANLHETGFNPQNGILDELAQKLVEVRKIPRPKGELEAFPVRLAAARPVIAEVREYIEGLTDGAFKTELAPVLAAISAFELSAAEADEFFA